MIPIQFITHRNDRYGYVDGARMALEGGCRWIQLRMKEASDDEMTDAARQIETLCRRYKVRFILDDRVHLCRKVNADGVHLGRNDMPIKEARAVLGADCIIGGTANTMDDVRRIAEQGADYIGCGPFRFTRTKKNLSPVLGVEGYRHIVGAMRSEGIHLPVVAIGGITSADIAPLMETGVDGIALSGTVLEAENPADEMRKIISISIQYEKQY